MTTLTNAHRDARQRFFHGTKRKKNQLDNKPASTPFVDPANVGMSRQCRFKREAPALG